MAIFSALNGSHVVISGGAGFVGSSLVRRLLQIGVAHVTVVDNFSSGSRVYLKKILGDSRLQVAELDIKDTQATVEIFDKCDVTFHLASNPDIAAAISDPSIDFWEGTYLTQNILEAMRINDCKTIVYASGSGVYGDVGQAHCSEDMGSFHPISTYGASKLAGEALISSYCHMFQMNGAAFRFANLVGPRQTHGVAYDFIRKLINDPKRLQILGDGKQSKSYLHVNDAIEAMLMLPSQKESHFECFNIGTGDYITVQEIAGIVVEEMSLNEVKFEYTGGYRGWKGDVPVVRLALQKAFDLGWRPTMNSKEAIHCSVQAMLGELNFKVPTATESALNK
jgi:UDP-glucose 4-epimerase